MEKVKTDGGRQIGNLLVFTVTKRLPDLLHTMMPVV
jgi:hypothetical protein